MAMVDTTTGRFYSGDGTAALPGITYENDTDTGIFRFTTNQIGISSGGVRTAVITPTIWYFEDSWLYIKDGTPTLPALAFNNDTDTGLFRPGTNRLSIVAGGVTSSTFTSNGLTINGSANSSVSALTLSGGTATMSCTQSNFFTISLGSGLNTINASGIQVGQTINLLVTTTASNSISFGTSIKQISGATYSPTNGAGTDILTLISFDSTNLYLVAAKNFI